MPHSTPPDDATYCLVDRDGKLWPAVYCPEDMVPPEEIEIRPVGYYQAVLLLTVFEFKWVLSSNIFEFDPSESQRIPDDSHKAQLKAAFDSVLGSPSLPGHMPYPDLGFWRSELLARNLDGISNGSNVQACSALSQREKIESISRTESISSVSDHDQTLSTPSKCQNPTTPPSKDIKRPWAKFKLEKDTSPANKKKKTEKKTEQKPKPWFPGEDDDDAVNAPPPEGYFEQLKKEHDRIQKLHDLTLSDTSDSDGSGTTEGDSDGESDSESSDAEDRKLTSKPQPKIKPELKANPPTPPSSRTLSSRSPATRKPPTTKPSAATQQQDRNQQEITQLCQQLDGARRASHRPQAAAAATQLLARKPWSDASTLLIARAAFRVPLRLDAKVGFMRDLRGAVARHLALHYERLRASCNDRFAIVMRDHRDLAEAVYERRLETIRGTAVEVIEIESD